MRTGIELTFMEQKMKLEILGSGGAVTAPKPFCTCTSCTEARKKNHTRYGPSVFIHGPDILIDTPEEIAVEVNRTELPQVQAVFYSHWHPDHTAGKRFFEKNIDWIGLPPKNKKTKVVLTETIAATFKSNMALMDSFSYFSHLGIIDLLIIKDDEELELSGYVIKPVQLAMDYVFGYEISGDGQKFLLIMDELKNWQPGAAAAANRYTLVYLPLGIFDINPFTHKRLIDENHPTLKDEQTIEETLETVQKLNSDTFVLSHIEEPDNITYALGKRLSKYYSEKTHKNIILAYDGMII